MKLLIILAALVACNASSIPKTPKQQKLDDPMTLNTRIAEMHYVTKKLNLENAAYMSIQQTKTLLDNMQAQIKEITKDTQNLILSPEIPMELSKMISGCLDSTLISNMAMQATSNTKLCMKNTVLGLKKTMNETMQKIDDEKMKLAGDFKLNDYDLSMKNEKRMEMLNLAGEWLDLALPKMDIMLEARNCVDMNMALFNSGIQNLVTEFRDCADLYSM